jgi:hypothetical protein
MSYLSGIKRSFRVNGVPVDHITAMLQMADLSGDLKTSHDALAVPVIKRVRENKDGTYSISDTVAPEIRQGAVALTEFHMQKDVEALAAYIKSNPKEWEEYQKKLALVRSRVLDQEMAAVAKALAPVAETKPVTPIVPVTPTVQVTVPAIAEKVPAVNGKAK